MVNLILYISETSPYARIPRIVLREKRLHDQVEEKLGQTRTRNSPYYAVNPSGRIPFLQGPDGLSLEGSTLIAEYLDHLDGAPIFDRPKSADRWQELYFEEMARSLMDGLAVWGRELKRPELERSATLLEHEQERAARLIQFWEELAGHPVLIGPLNLTQITLATALDMDQRITPFNWRTDNPGLDRWMTAISARPSLRQTAVPPGQSLG